MAILQPFDEVHALLAGDVSVSTVQAYAGDCRRYVAFCMHAGLDPACVQSLRTWRHHQVVKTELSPHTINRRILAVKRTAAALAQHNRLEPALAAEFALVKGVRPRAVKTRIKRHYARLSPETMRQLCSQPVATTMRGLRDRALLATLASSGARVSEVLALTPAHVTHLGPAAFITVCGKTDTLPRQAPLSLEAAAHITRWLDARPVESALIFTSFTGNRPLARPLNPSTVWRMVRRYGLKVGRADVSPHSFRRFVATELARRDLRQAQRALGHRRLETTIRYLTDELEGGLTDGLY